MFILIYYKQIWTIENLDFCGCNRYANNFPVNKPPTTANFSWCDWNQIGGELILSAPVDWSPNKVNPNLKNYKLVKNEVDNSCASSDEDKNEDYCDGDTSNDDVDVANEENQHLTFRNLMKESEEDRKALDRNLSKVCKVQSSSYLVNLMQSGAVYQAVLTCYARLRNITESEVMDEIRRDRRLRTAPDSARLQYEPNSGFYYDPETCLYYDASRGYFYDSSKQTYYHWSKTDQIYVPANALIQAEVISDLVSQNVVRQAANQKALTEREAAKLAGQKVAAQLAEIRANKDEYAGYVYATCILPQAESSGPNYADFAQNNYSATSKKSNLGANEIESSLINLNRSDHFVNSTFLPYKDERRIKTITRSATPPPPGL